MKFEITSGDSHDQALNIHRTIVFLCAISCHMFPAMDLAGHFPIKLSRVLAGFLDAADMNSLTVTVCGKMKI